MVSWLLGVVITANKIYFTRRNDFISVVRDAARTALERMEVPEAEEVLKVTRVLEEEIKQLQGNIVQVWTVF